MAALCPVLLALALALGLTACHSETPSPPKAAEAPVVRDVAVVAVAPTEIQETTEAVGTVKSRTSTTISSRIVGRVQALHAREGSRVEPGQLLAELDDRDILTQVRRAEAGLAEAQGALAEVERAIVAAAAGQAAAQAQRDLADATLARYQRLLDRRSVAPAEYDQVAAKSKAAAADLERATAEGQVIQAKRQQALARIEAARADSASAQIQRGYARILAPIAGVVTAKHADVGSLAAPGTPLLTLEDGRRYWLEAMVPESQLAAVRPGQSLRFAVESAGLSGSAPVSEVLPSADPATRTTLVRLELPASPRLRSGLFGRVWIAGSRRQVLQVPRAAIVERGQLEGVFVVGPDGLARFRLVRTGAGRDSQVELLSGLTAGEQIVVDGAQNVTDGARIERKS